MRHKIGAAPVLRLTQPQGESRRWDLVSSQVLPVGLVLRNWSQLTSNVRWIESISAICRRLSTNQWLKRLLVPEATGRLLLSVGLFGFKRRHFSIRWNRKKSWTEDVESRLSVGQRADGAFCTHANYKKKKFNDWSIWRTWFPHVHFLSNFFQNDFRHLIFSIFFLIKFCEVNNWFCKFQVQ